MADEKTKLFMDGLAAGRFGDRPLTPYAADVGKSIAQGSSIASRMAQTGYPAIQLQYQGWTAAEAEAFIAGALYARNQVMADRAQAQAAEQRAMGPVIPPGRAVKEGIELQREQEAHNARCWELRKLMRDLAIRRENAERNFYEKQTYQDVARRSLAGHKEKRITHDQAKAAAKARIDKMHADYRKLEDEFKRRGC